MAEQAQAAANAVKEAVSDVTEKVGELTTQDNATSAAAEGKTTFLDEVTGEQVSKTECTRRTLLRHVDPRSDLD